MTTSTVAHGNWCPPAGRKIRRDLWPFYLDRQQRARLRRLREVWGEETVIQIYGGGVRIIGEGHDWWFWSIAELDAATTVRRRREMNRSGAP